MGPKKEAKNAVEQPAKEVEPEILPFQTVGYGRFEYLNGVRYEGSWKLVKGAQVKEGFGRLTISQQLPQGGGEESYEGNWENDKMHGFGTYLYPDGSTYSGQWENNKHHGRGIFSFANGTHYEGEWRNHLMHGRGCFTDHLKRKWEGHFRQGAFESRKQMELSKEKELLGRKNEVKQQIRETMKALQAVLEGEQKKNYKISMFFPSAEQGKALLKGELLTFLAKSKQNWVEVLQQAEKGDIVMLEHRADCKTIDGERILMRQQQGEGQAVEVFFNKEGKRSSLLWLQVEKQRWVLAALNEGLS